MTWPPPRRLGAAVTALWALSRLLLLVLALNPDLYNGAIHGDVRGYGAKVERMFQGELPYRDVAIEYPPGSVPFTLLPALLAGTGANYRLAFALTMLAVDAVGLWAAFRLGRATDAGSRRWRVPLAYTAATVALGPIAYMRFDYVPAVCVLLAAAFAAERRAGAAAAALGFGTAAKLFPAVLAPLLVLGLVPALGWRGALRRTVPAFTVALALPVLPAVAISPTGTFNWVIGYHLDRGVQVESLWANAILLVHHLGGLPAMVGYEFGAFDLLSPWSAEAKALSGPVTLAALGGVAWLTWQRARRDGGIPPSGVPAVLAAGVIAFILASRVLSPQYLVWVMPLVAAMAASASGGRARSPATWWREPAWRALGCLLVAALVTQVIFPFRYDQLRALEGFESGLLTLRNALLVASAAAIVAVLRRPPSSAAPLAAPWAGFRLSQRTSTIRESNIRSVDGDLTAR